MSSFWNPVEVRFGRGQLRELESLLEPPVLLVTGRKTLQRTGLHALLRARSELHAFACVEENPSSDTIDRGIGALGEVQARTVVGVGGGSAMDAAKCIAAVAYHARDLEEFARGEGERARRVRLVQVPTTAGTGADVTRWASIWDGGRKRSFDRASAYADVALVDPTLHDPMGPRLTAATGLDAVAHAMESIWGLQSNPISDALAERALSLAGRHLEAAVARPTPGERDGMAKAALFAGLALSSCKSAGAHALSYGMTGRFGLEHGLAVGLLCRGFLRWNRDTVPASVDRIEQALGVDDLGHFIGSIFEAADLRPSLASFGIDPSAYGGLIDDALAADRLANHPGPPDRNALARVLEDVA